MSHGRVRTIRPAVGGLSTAELARRLGVETTWVDRLAAAGAIEPAADGTYDPGDVHRVRLLLAFEESGVPLDALLEASAAGRISLRYYDELHPPPTTLTGRTYDAFAASLGDGRPHLPQLFAAFGIAEPDGDVDLSTDDETVLAGSSMRSPPPASRTSCSARSGCSARVRAGRPTRRSGSMPRPSTGRRRPRGASGGRAVRPAVPAVGPLRRNSVAWRPGSSRRHLSRAIDDYSIVESERILEESGFVGARRRPAGRRVRRPDGLHPADRGAGRRGGGGVALRLGDV